MPKLKVRKIEYYHDQGDFLQKLKEFHDARGTPLGRLPTFGGQSLDLYALYNTVTSLGGISVVTDKKKWDDVFRLLGFPPCTNAAYALRQHYARYLESYERIFFFGEDDESSDQNMLLSQRLRYRKINRPPKLGHLGEPLVHNFDRISFSLQSGISNEVNFALNICTLLSNVTNSIFNLAKSRNILDLMLAHVGVWSENDNNMKSLYQEWYSGEKCGFGQFWDQYLEGDLAKIMYRDFFQGGLSTKEEPIESPFFASSLQLKNINLCRVNQVALILYNFSFEQINSMYMGSHEATKKFLLLACCSKVPSLCKSGLETLDNICHYVTLPSVESKESQFVFYVLDNFISSNDKFRRSRAISILGKLALNESNNDVLSAALTPDYYQRLVQMLYLPDVVLILSSLDALYSLSGLCENTATGIAMIHGSIEILVSLLTIRAESFGNNAIKGYRIIENKHSIFTQKNQELLRQREQQHFEQQQAAAARRHFSNNFSFHQHHNRPPPPPQPFPHYGNRVQPPLPIPPHIGFHQPRPPPPSTPPRLPPNIPREPVPPTPPQPSPATNHMVKSADELVEIDAEIFAAHWLSANYEPVQDGKVTVQDIYKEFFQACQEFQRKAILPEAQFFQLLKSILPPHINRIDGDTPQSFTICVGKRKNTIAIQSNIPKSMHENLLKHKSALLKRTNQHTPINPNTPTQESTPSKDSKTADENKTQSTSDDFQNNPLYKHILEDKDLNSLQVCQDLAEKLKSDSEFHFTQFHAHRQQFQAMQFQMQQLLPQLQSQQANGEQQPMELIKNITMRTQSHHQVMQIHYTQLEYLSKLLMHIQRKLSSRNLTDKPLTPSADSEKNGVPTNFPAQKPYFPILGTPNGVFPDSLVPQLPFQHTPYKQHSSKSNRGKIKTPRSISASKKRQTSRGSSRSNRAKPRMNDLPQESTGVPFDQSNSPSVNNFPPYDVSSNFIPRAPSLQSYPPRAPSLTASKFTHSPCSSFLPPGKTNTHSQPSATIDLNNTNESLRKQIIENVAGNAARLSDNNTVSKTTQIEPLCNKLESPVTLSPLTAPAVISTTSQLPSSSHTVTNARATSLSPIISSVENSVNSVTDNQSCNKKLSTLDNLSDSSSSIKPSTSPVNKVDGDEFLAIKDKNKSVDGETNTEMTNSLSSNVDRKSYETDATNDHTESESTNSTESEHVDNINTSLNSEQEINCGKSQIMESHEENGTPICENGDTLPSDNSSKILNGNVHTSPLQLNGDVHHSESPTKEKTNEKAISDTKHVDAIDYSKCNGHLNGHIDNEIKQTHLCNGDIDHTEKGVTVVSDKKSVNSNSTGQVNSKSPLTEISDMVTDDSRAEEETSKLMTLDIENPLSHNVLPNISSLANVSSEETQKSEALMETLTTTVTKTTTHTRLLSAEETHTKSFHCLWESCNLPDFKNSSSLLSHMIVTHAPLESRIGFCMVKGCGKVPRMRGAMIAHFQEDHCATTNEDGTTGKVKITESLFTNKLVPPLYVEDESPVTRSVRYTAVLILRNIAKRSPYGKSVISRYESRISMVALSSSEAAGGASDCLLELLREETSTVEDDKATIITDTDTSETSDFEMLSEDDEFDGNYEDDLLTYVDSPGRFSS